MRNKKSSIVLIGAVLVAFGAASVQAAAQTAGDAAATQKTQASMFKEQKIGMASGTAIGALIGGPFGAGIGFIVGSMIGVGAGKVNETQRQNAMLTATLKQELAAAKNALAEVSAAQTKVEKVATETVVEPTLDQLAQQLRADVMFRTGSAELNPSAATKLADLGAVLGRYPSLKIDIDGYADPRGKVGENLELSQQRALSVRAALIVGGAKPDNIIVAAHGEQLSTAAKGDLEAYAWERRASLSVTTTPTGALAQVK